MHGNTSEGSERTEVTWAPEPSASGSYTQTTKPNHGAYAPDGTPTTSSGYCGEYDRAPKTLNAYTNTPTRIYGREQHEDQSGGYHTQKCQKTSCIRHHTSRRHDMRMCLQTKPPKRRNPQTCQWKSTTKRRRHRHRRRRCTRQRRHPRNNHATPPSTFPLSFPHIATQQRHSLKFQFSFTYSCIQVFSKNPLL